MIARCVDERHVSRGYDPYNSADQVHLIAARNEKKLDRATDLMIRRGLNYLVKTNSLPPAIFPPIFPPI